VSRTIAISGKGGSGKTTVAALVVRALVERGARGVLAVDADPNACLGMALGLEPETTVGEVRDRTLDRSLQTGPGMDRERAFEYALQRAVAEGRGFDLLAMGHTEGPKCYCAVNNLLRKYLDGAQRQYRWVVLDNEAGMEHLSRRTTDAVDQLVVVASPTPIGLRTAERILGLAERLPVVIGARGVLWNPAAEADPLPPGADPLPALGRLPRDPAVERMWQRGETVFDLPADCAALAAVGRLLDAPAETPAPPAPQPKENA
jgi:CO dehydrogenase maturation factor